MLLAAGALSSFELRSQCGPGEVSLSMNIYTDPWGYETYWEIVPGTNACGDGTIAWGSNLESVGCTGGGEANAYGTETAYPSNTVIPVDNICLTEGEYYTLYFVDDWGDGGLWFEMFDNGSLFAFYAGTGIGNAWTFQAGVSPLGPYDSPCSAVVLNPGAASAVDLNNINCVTQVNEIHPFLGHCTASGTWCPDEVNKTLWAKFTVPDDGSYEISTVHNGTYINTQMAVWVSEDCSDMSNFILVAANDDYWGDSGISECGGFIPPCVDQASAGFLNVITEMPQCCSNEWSQECQDLYDSVNGSCTSDPTCSFLLEGFDSYGDGWNDGFITVTINGESTDYTFYSGGYQSWPLELSTGDEISITFTPGGWPEEVTVGLKGPDGVYDLYIQPVNLDPLIFEDVINCMGEVMFHPQSSRCYVNCLPAGTECYIQIDGHGGESGEFVLSVKPYTEEPEILAEVTDLVCPPGIGTIPQGLIVTYIQGWGLNYWPQWTADNGYSSNDYHPYEVNDGIYTLNAIDACGNEINVTYEVEGPDPFFFASESSSTCPENTDGYVETQFSGGTAPYYDYYWLLPDSTMTDALALDELPAGVYQFHLTDGAGCSVIETVVVNELPSPVFNLGEDFSVCDEFMTQIEGPAGMVDYEWSQGGQAQNAILSDEDFAIGTHEISLTVFNEFGCTYTDAISFEVVECTDVNDQMATSIVAYPQPADLAVIIAGLPARDILLTLTDLSGNVVAGYKSGGLNKMEIPTQQLSAGVYILSMHHTAGTLNYKLVVTH